MRYLCFRIDYGNGFAPVGDTRLGMYTHGDALGW